MLPSVAPSELVHRYVSVSCRWSAKGSVFISNMRVVFIAKNQDSSSPIHAFDLPLLYIRNDKFNQPIFGCNHLAGECWPVSPTGGPGGSLPPFKWKLNFLSGGVGTLLPMYYRYMKAVREAEHDRKTAEMLANHGFVEQQVHQAFVDPNDPTTLYLTQPVGNDARLPDVPVYASNYGKDEAYAPLV